jgi:diguanylate cyclase (GGDEF)-like protein/PAS domain S-box-containing protein
MLSESIEDRQREQCPANGGHLCENAAFYRVLTESMPDCVGILDAGAALRYANKCWAAYTGCNVAERGFPNLGGFLHPDDAQELSSMLQDMTIQAEVRRDLRILRSDGMYRWHELRIVPISEGVEHRKHWLFSCRDIEERISAQTKLREANRLMQMAENITHVGYWRVDLLSNSVYWSDEVYNTLGVDPATRPTLEAAISAYHPDDREQVGAIVDKAFADGSSFAHESRIIRADGAIRDIASNGQAERDVDGNIVAVFGVFQDITWRKDAERERQRLSERVIVATQAASVGVWEWDILTDTLVWDSIMLSLYGLDADATAPNYQTWTESLHAEDRERVDILLKRTVSGEGPFDTEFRIFWPNGAQRVIRAMATALLDGTGKPLRVIGTNSDITEIRGLADQLRHEKEAAMLASTHDALTSLLNRRGLEAWVGSSSQESCATLLYLDIDGFKAINDRGGHEAGDDTLRDVARIIGEAVRDGDLTARVGGDEFVVVLRDTCDYATTQKIIARITAAVSSMRPLGPINTGRIGISVGVGHFGGAATFSNAVREADANLYRRKAEKKKRLIESVHSRSSPDRQSNELWDYGAL